MSVGYEIIDDDLTGFKGDAILLKFDAPSTLDEDEEWVDTVTVEYVVISAVTVLGEPETYIFESDSDGNIVDWLELPGSLRGTLDHDAVIDNMVSKVAQ